MKKFTVRVFIANENDSAIDELKDKMLAAGFSECISSDQGTTYSLPPGEFSFEGEIDRRSLLEKVQAAANQIGKDYSTLITESRGRTWYNLKPLKTKDN